MVLRDWSVADLMLMKYLLQDENKSVDQIAEALGNRHTPGAISSKINELALTHRIVHWKDGEFERVKELFLQYKTWAEIQQTLIDEFKTLRSPGVLRLRVFQAGLKRDRRKQTLINRYGQADTLEELEARRTAKLNEQADAYAVELKANKEQVAAALEKMKQDLITGVPRRLAYRRAMDEGATLQNIGDIVGVTRERIRQIVNPEYRGREVMLKKLAFMSEAELQSLLAEAKVYREQFTQG